MKKINSNLFFNSSMLIAFLLLFQINAYSQKAIGARTADASAVLELQSKTKGFLPPRLTTAQRDAIVLPAQGLILYNSTLETLSVNIGTALLPNWENIAPVVTAEDLLTSTSTSNALSANQGRVLEDNKADITNILALDNTTSYSPSEDFEPATKEYIDDAVTIVEDVLTATSTTNALSANQGRVLMKNKLDNTLNPGHIYVGDASNIATGVALSGDATIASNGTLTIADNAVDGSDISLANEALGDIAYFDGTNWVRLARGTSGHSLTTDSNGLPYWNSRAPGENVDYSTTEQDTGMTWADGSAIYQKSFVAHTSTTLITGISRLINAQGEVEHRSFDLRFTLQAYENTQHWSYILQNNSGIYFYKSSDLDSFTGTIYYTKP